jgi:hypothetical protein
MTTGEAARLAQADGIATLPADVALIAPGQPTRFEPYRSG